MTRRDPAMLKQETRSPPRLRIRPFQAGHANSPSLRYMLHLRPHLPASLPTASGPTVCAGTFCKIDYQTPTPPGYRNVTCAEALLNQAGRSIP